MQLCTQARSDCLPLGRRQPRTARGPCAATPSLRQAAARRQLGTRRHALTPQAQAMDSNPTLPPPPPPAPAAPGLGQRVLRIAGVAGATVALALASAAPAFAARSGGRMGGSSFGRSSFSSSGSFGSGAGARSWGSGAGAASSRGSWGGGSTFGSSWRSSSRAGSTQPLTGGFGSSYSTPSMSVRTNSFFLSPWGFGELPPPAACPLLPGPDPSGLWNRCTPPRLRTSSRPRTHHASVGCAATRLGCRSGDPR